jgi:hypothetical protein
MMLESNFQKLRLGHAPPSNPENILFLSKPADSFQMEHPEPLLLMELKWHKITDGNNGIALFTSQEAFFIIIFQ